MEFINNQNIKLTTKERVCCIYLIRNLVNKKVYIGQTTNFRKRLSDYRNLHKKKSAQRIARAIKEYGNENFTIEILKICSPDELTKYEDFYIDEFKAYSVDYGYNIVKEKSGNNNSDQSRLSKSIAHIGLKESDSTKRIKSNPILVVDTETGVLFAAESAKLFGDLIHKTKDQVKNYLRIPLKYESCFFYYDDIHKRQEIRKRLKIRTFKWEKDYIRYLDYIDKIEIEGVETNIYDYFQKVYIVSYDSNNAIFNHFNISEWHPSSYDPNDINTWNLSSYELEI